MAHMNPPVGAPEQPLRRLDLFQLTLNLASRTPTPDLPAGALWPRKLVGLNFNNRNLLGRRIR